MARVGHERGAGLTDPRQCGSAHRPQATEGNTSSDSTAYHPRTSDAILSASLYVAVKERTLPNISK